MNGDDEAGSGRTNLGWGGRSWIKEKTQIHQNPKETKPNSQYLTKIARERLVLGCDENHRFWVDRCWGATILPVVRSVRWGSEMVRSNGFSGFDEWVWALLDERARSWVFWIKRSQFLGSDFSSLSLSLCAHLSPEILWSENSNGNHFTPKQGYFPVKAEIIYRWPYFPCAAKHPLLWKSISRNNLKSKQTHPKLHVLYGLKIHVKFHINQMLFIIIWSINLFILMT